ncbi:exodeoxyribonuclease VII small subunit [Desulfonauticus submarinus]
MAPTNSFDNNLKKLEEIANLLSQDDLSLEKGIKLFKEGMKIIAKCKTQLQKAKDEVETYLQSKENEA